MGRAPMPDDGGDIDGVPCVICAGAIAPAELVRLRLQRPAGTVKRPSSTSSRCRSTSNASPG